MTDIDEGELTPREAAAFATLPRMSAADELAEQRTVQALRELQLLTPTATPQRRHGLAIGAAIAASLLLFAAGTMFGKTLAVHESTPSSPSVQVQQTGTAYVAALVRLSRATDTERTPGIEAGAATLRAAATSLALIDPSDPIATRIRTSLAPGTSSPNPAGDRSVIWF